MKELCLIVYSFQLSPCYLYPPTMVAGWELEAHSCNFWSVAKEAGQWPSTSISHLQSYQCIDTKIMTTGTSTKLLVVTHHPSSNSYHALWSHDSKGSNQSPRLCTIGKSCTTHTALGIWPLEIWLSFAVCRMSDCMNQAMNTIETALDFHWLACSVLLQELLQIVALKSQAVHKSNHNYQFQDATL